MLHLLRTSYPKPCTLIQPKASDASEADMLRYPDRNFPFILSGSRPMEGQEGSPILLGFIPVLVLQPCHSFDC